MLGREQHIELPHPPVEGERVILIFMITAQSCHGTTTTTMQMAWWLGF
jgi:hypothetical protein